MCVWCAFASSDDEGEGEEEEEDRFDEEEEEEEEEEHRFEALLLFELLNSTILAGACLTILQILVVYRALP